MDVVIFAASEKEINPILYQTSIKFIKDGSLFYSEYRDINIKIYITGIGERAKVFFDSFDNNLNNDSETTYFKFGTCGVIGDIPLLTTVSPNNIYYEDKIIKLKNRSSTNHTLLTITKSIDLNEVDLIGKKLNINFDIIDMETFFAAVHFKNIIPILVTTDYNNRDEFFTNITKASLILKDFFISLLKRDLS